MCRGHLNLSLAVYSRNDPYHFRNNQQKAQIAGCSEVPSSAGAARPRTGFEFRGCSENAESARHAHIIKAYRICAGTVSVPYHPRRGVALRYLTSDHRHASSFRVLALYHPTLP